MEKSFKRKKRFITIVSTVMMVIVLMGLVIGLCGCDDARQKDIEKAISAGTDIIINQPAPTDLNYSLERYNVIRRAYWVNGQRQKAMSLPCAVEKPLGYIVLFSSSGAVIQRFVVDGKVSSLNSYLYPAYWDVRDDDESEQVEVPGIDGCYGENVSGIFFFTTDGKYIEWTGDFLYSDIPFTVDDPILKTE